MVFLQGVNFALEDTTYSISHQNWKMLKNGVAMSIHKKRVHELRSYLLFLAIDAVHGDGVVHEVSGGERAIAVRVPIHACCLVAHRVGQPIALLTAAGQLHAQNGKKNYEKKRLSVNCITQYP